MDNKELDLALDSEYRETVAKVLQSESKAQYLITTFKPEVVREGDKFFQIEYQNRISRVKEVSLDEALEKITPSETTKKN